MPSTRITDLSVTLADAWLGLREEYEARWPSKSLLLTCTARSPSEQFVLYKVGRHEAQDGSWQVDGDPKSRTLTECDGYVRLSRHNLNPSEALDLVAFIAGKVTWAWAEYEAVGLMGEARGLRWGGRFPKGDGPHLELPH